MSVESAKQFLDKMKSDETYAQSVVEAASREARTALVKDQGFEFSKEDLEAAAMDIGGDVAVACGHGGILDGTLGARGRGQLGSGVCRQQGWS